MKKYFLFAMMAILCVSCNINTPDNQSVKTYGKIVGTVGCFDVNDERTLDEYRKAVVIETSNKDSLLSFTMDFEGLNVPFRYGTLSIAA